MQETERIGWIDIAKGFAVVMVIIAHIKATFFSHSDWTDSILSTLHNPTFFISSGFLLALKLSKMNAKMKSLDICSFYFKKLIIPFLIWLIIFSGLTTVFFHYEIRPAFVDSANRLWFLPVLYVGIVFALFLKRVRVAPTIIYAIFSSLILVSSYFSSLVAKVACFSLLVYIGYNIGLTAGNKKPKMLFFLIAIYIILLVANIFEIIKPIDYISASGIKLFCGLLMSMVGGGIVIIISQIIAKWKKAVVFVRFLSFVGINSLYFYILHFFGIYYLEANKPNNLLTGCVGVVITVSCPSLFIILIKQTKMNKLLFCSNYSVK